VKSTKSSTGAPRPLKGGLAVNKPRRLAAGGRIGVIAPAGCVDRASLQPGIQALRAEGFEVELGRSVFARR
jgi:muramoyltetrapeptide carboxypeptidase LdcA involved in peptidoglycan recycling